MDAEPHTAPYAGPDTATRRAATADPLTSRSAAGPLRREQVYAELKRRILLGEFSTRTRLAEERLAGLLDVSRTPVREALVALHADRLVQRDPEGGYYVAEPNLAGLRDLYELRIALELHGLTRAGEDSVRHDVSILEPLRESWRALGEGPPPPDPQFVEVDESFHVALSRAAGNAVLTEMLETVNARIRPVRMYDFLTGDRIERTIEQHLAIVDAVLAGNVTGAVDELRRHVGVSLEVVERRAARAITQMVMHRGGRP